MGKQLFAIQEHLRNNPNIKHVWYDFWCMPQRKDKNTDDRSLVDLTEFKHMLSCIADLYLTTKVLILLDNSYVGRCVAWSRSHDSGPWRSRAHPQPSLRSPRAPPLPSILGAVSNTLANTKPRFTHGDFIGHTAAGQHSDASSVFIKKGALED